MPNTRTALRRQFAKGILDEPYLKSLKERALAGDLPPQVEVLLLHYLLGKPTEEIEHIEASNDLLDASTEQLLAQVRELEQVLAARVAADALPGLPSDGSAVTDNSGTAAVRKPEPSDRVH